MINDITVQGGRRVELKLQGIARKITDLTPAFNDMKVKIIELFKKNFDAQGNIVGSRWAARKYSYPWPTLNRTGKMKNTWKDKTQKLRLEIENPVKYSGYHQFGTTRLPIRAIVGVSPPITNVIVEAIKRYIKSSIT